MVVGDTTRSQDQEVATKSSLSRDDGGDDDVLARLAEVGVHVPQILLPRAVDLKKWCVIACDQYSAERAYWERVSKYVNDAPSALRLIYPEAYLPEKRDEFHLTQIEKYMGLYLSEERGTGAGAEVLGHEEVEGHEMSPKTPGMTPKRQKVQRGEPVAEMGSVGRYFDRFLGFVLVERTLPVRQASSPYNPENEHDETKRRGLLLSLDLDQYEYTQNARSLIRATEKTVVSRLPVRTQIRQRAQLELPHIIILVDDPDRRLITPLFDRFAGGAEDQVNGSNGSNKCYSVDLMENGGRVEGWKVPVTDTAAMAYVADVLGKLRAASSTGMLFAVGDGNHSLAAAKCVWEQEKEKHPMTAEQKQLHPARYALVEVQNIHDTAIKFEPIHRLLFDAKPTDVLARLRKYCDRLGHGCKFDFVPAQGSPALSTGSGSDAEVPPKDGETADGETADGSPTTVVEEDADAGAQRTPEPGNSTSTSTTPQAEKKEVSVHRFEFLTAKPELNGMVVVKNPPHALPVGFLQAFLDENEWEMEYLHGADALERCIAGERRLCCGFLLPPIGSKAELFQSVNEFGTLPRKAFSMGEADEKRFYLEARRIKLPEDANQMVPFRSPVSFKQEKAYQRFHL
mmetsp:Transcript_15834/g.39162  ORF Transcript_15834/g.39162 Transcript_15834/m.39162 type:complete len:626 (+) Transcript_15834:268-2145(+)|eukprot:CAMPEP_0179003422 /NCGR_PEP_ID=MMETSP0795-20121207/12674_1 /TAXON_ID=88552 /ORGANISM="Amoebophrya sp., Strain Ameob2" /LENGTH=625 /DNA_ID=CAMNT_0020697439 /DNA_START=202 /DNA_END=2079 /DNA_ORIENTATION=-